MHSSTFKDICCSIGLSSLLIFAHCTHDVHANIQPPRYELTGQRGALLATLKQRSYKKLELAALFELGDLSTDPLKHDIDIYKIVYETIDPEGQPTVASGALAWPVMDDAPLGWVSYQHGTVLRDNDVPSQNSKEQWVGATLAAYGYVAVLPDYLGLGDDAARFHPFLHASSEASATIDLLRAARVFSLQQSRAPADKLFLTGYSQGAHATLATQRDIEANFSAEFIITSTAAGAGPYDLSGVTLDVLLSGALSPAPYQMPYLLLAYNSLYHLYAEPSQFLRPPYDQETPLLFDGITDASVINATLPPVPRDILSSMLLAQLDSDTMVALTTRLEQNNVFDWTARAPIRLYHCASDTTVTPANTTVAFNALSARGANVERIDPSPQSDHLACVLPMLLDAKRWFDTQ